MQAYRANGTGLGTAEFRRLCNLNKVPPPEDRGEGWTDHGNESKKESKDEEEALSSDSDDSTYFGANEKDISFEADTDEELPDKEEEEDHKMPAKKKVPSGNKNVASRKKMAPDLAEVEEAMKKVELESNEDGDLKYMYKLADGRICCVFQLTSGFEGNFEFNPGRKKTKVMLKRVMPRWAYIARRVFRRKGLDANNVNVVELQTIMDKRRKEDIIAMGGNPETYTGVITRSREVFDVTALGVDEVLPFFLDEIGVQTTDINADAGSGAEWVFFWLRDKETVQETHPVGRIVRNNTRGRNSMDTDDEEAARPRARSSNESAEYHNAHAVPPA